MKTLKFHKLFPLPSEPIAFHLANHSERFCMCIEWKSFNLNFVSISSSCSVLNSQKAISHHKSPNEDIKNYFNINFIAFSRLFHCICRVNLNPERTKKTINFKWCIHWNHAMILRCTLWCLKLYRNPLSHSPEHILRAKQKKTSVHNLNRTRVAITPFSYELINAKYHFWHSNVCWNICKSGTIKSLP